MRIFNLLIFLRVHMQGRSQELEMGGAKLLGKGLGPVKAQRGVHMHLRHPPDYGLAN